MAYFIGVALALAISVFATLVRFDRDRSFYPTVMLVIASTYALFAVMGDSLQALGLEAIPIVGFIVVTVLGFRVNLWLVVGALAGHGVFDFFHGRVISNPGVPVWWPMFCLAYDVAAAGYLAWLLLRARVAANPPAD